MWESLRFPFDINSSNRTGIPFLSHIPLLGALFRGDTKSKQREELVIMIQPQVVETDEELAALQAAESKRQVLGKQASEYEKTSPPSLSTKGKVP